MGSYGKERNVDRFLGKNVWEKILGRAGKSLLLILLGSAAGLAALLLVFCLPVDSMQAHVWQSLPLIEEEFWDAEVISGNAATLTGSFTDCLMLEHAVYKSEEHGLLEQVLYMYRGESGEGDGWAPGFSLKDYLEGTGQPREAEYPRYWHGYLLVLKPLLMLTTLPSIRMLAAAVQLILAGTVMLLCGRRKENLLGMAFIVSIPFLYFFSMFTSLSLSVCFYLMAGAVAAQLIWHEKWNEKGRYYVFFLIVGMATSYFDFLTYPLITLGYPLCVCLYLNREDWRESLKKLVGYSAEWGLGYLGLWAMKWILTDVLTGGSVIRDALDTLSTRTETAEGYSRLEGFMAVLKQNAGVYANWSFALLLLGMLAGLLLMTVRKRRAFGKRGLACGMVLLLVALYPLGWFFLTQNHAQQHWMYTCKILAVTVFAGICAVGKCFREGGEAGD